MSDPCAAWLVGGAALSRSPSGFPKGSGVFHGAPGAVWQRLGNNQSPPLCLFRQKERLLLGAHSGLWEWRRQEGGWVQFHDETLTEVLAMGPASGDPGIMAACPYGVATPQRDQRGACRWKFHSVFPRPDERFANALLADPADPGRCLVGTEAGVLLFREKISQWEYTGLAGTPVRALLHAQDWFWAGTDDKGVWRSRDGLSWERAGTGVEGAVFSLAATHDRVLAATQHGMVVGDGQGRWHGLGPRLLMAAVAVHPQAPDAWLAGACPGGLWYTQDRGLTWKQTGDFRQVRALLAPEEVS